MPPKPIDPQDDVTPTRPISEAERHAKELTEALRHRTALLHEIDHRVKNNLQLIASLLVLQCRRVDDPGTRAALRSMLERVNAVATVHRRLFRSEDLESFDVAEFLRDLTTDLVASLGREGVSLRLDLEPVAVPAAQAAPLALVVSEVIANALKHAFPNGRSGVVEVALRRQPGRFELIVADDGVGGFDGTPGFGATIIELLSKQLRAQLSIEPTQPGRRVAVSVPLNTSSG